MSDTEVLLMAACAVVGVLFARPVPLGVAVLVGVTAVAARVPLLALAAALLLGSSVSARSWEAVRPAAVPVAAQHYAGPATLVVDPVRRGPLTHVVLRVGRQRYDVWAAGSRRST